MRRGLLLTMTEPPPAMEEEFNAWYDTEHLAERLAIPGFRTAVRWVADVAPGEGKYLGTYELDSPDVLQSDEYLKRFNNQTPWSQRCLKKTVVFRRWACEQINPGDRPDAPQAEALFLAIGDVPNEHEAEFNKWYDEEHLPLLAAVPGVLSARRFRDPHGKPRYIAMYELSDPNARAHPQWQAAIRTPWSQRIDELTGDCDWVLRLYFRYKK